MIMATCTLIIYNVIVILYDTVSYMRLLYIRYRIQVNSTIAVAKRLCLKKQKN